MLNIKLANKVIRLIDQNEGMYCQSTWMKADISQCKVYACIAGWTLILNEMPNFLERLPFERTSYVREIAVQFLDIDVIALNLLTDENDPNDKEIRCRLEKIFDSEDPVSFKDFKEIVNSIASQNKE